MAKKIVSTKKEVIDKDPTIFYFVFKHGIIIYPISELEYMARKGGASLSFVQSKKFYIEVNNNGKKLVFPKSVSAQDIDYSIWKTIYYYYKILKQK